MTHDSLKSKRYAIDAFPVVGAPSVAILVLTSHDGEGVIRPLRPRWLASPVLLHIGFADFRPEPAGDDGHPMQQAIVEAAMAGEHVLGILPTGAGKSLCYQIPALSRYDKTGALTVVISPLVALMSDQVAGLEAHGIGSCVTINGLMSMPERADALDRVRLGDEGILIISPEQLRARSLRRVLDQREIGGWVLDEAHWLSRWGHDFRPDYRYVGRFIREKAGAGPVPPVLCLTATAKPDVTGDIVRHFRDKLGIGLKVFDGGAERPNLTFEVIPTSGGEKFAHIHQILTSYLPPDLPGGAIVYCATRRQSEEVAEFLQLKGVAADHFHAGLPPETKKGRAAALHRWRVARDCGDQRLRHGDRQAGRAAGHPRRHPGFVGELSSGGRTQGKREFPPGGVSTPSTGGARCSIAFIARGIATSAIWEDDVATVADDLRADLDELFAQRGQ